jgi:hypothetical protein
MPWSQGIPHLATIDEKDTTGPHHAPEPLGAISNGIKRVPTLIDRKAEVFAMPAISASIQYTFTRLCKSTYEIDFTIAQ